MFKQYLPILILLLCGFSVMAQTPEPLTGLGTTLRTHSPLAPCTGVASSGKTTQTKAASSKTSNKLFLCASDTLFIANTGSRFEDPNATTTPGIGYFFYNCPPSVSGPRWSDIITKDLITGVESSKDACLRTTIVNNKLAPVTARGDASGRDTFVNNGALQSHLIWGNL